MSKMTRAQSYIGKKIIHHHQAIHVLGVVVENENLCFQGYVINEDGTDLDYVAQAQAQVDHFLAHIERIKSGSFTLDGYTQAELLDHAQNSLKWSYEALDFAHTGERYVRNFKVNSRVRYEVI